MYKSFLLTRKDILENQEAIKKAMSFLYEMGCLACHGLIASHEDENYLDCLLEFFDPPLENNLEIPWSRKSLLEDAFRKILRWAALACNTLGKYKFDDSLNWKEKPPWVDDPEEPPPADNPESPGAPGVISLQDKLKNLKPKKNR